MHTLNIQGSIVALVTPFQSNGGVDENRLRELVNWHIQEGTHAIVPCGTTGESATLSHEEHHRVIDIVISEVAGRVPVISGAGSNSTAEAISLTEHAKKAGANAVLSISPYYNKPTQNGITEHYRAINGVGIPVIVYNVPGRTGTNISAQTTLELAKLENIAGIKEASGNLVQIMEILRGRPEGFRVFSGDDALAYPLMTLGADGCISVVANEVPQAFRTMMEHCLSGNFQEARNIHYQLLELMQTNFIESNPIPVKTALALMGKIEANLRLPLTPMGENTASVLKKVLQELDLITV